MRIASINGSIRRQVLLATPTHVFMITMATHRAVQQLYCTRSVHDSKNKQLRQAWHHKDRLRKAKEKRERRKQRKQQRESLGDDVRLVKQSHLLYLKPYSFFVLGSTKGGSKDVREHSSA